MGDAVETGFPTPRRFDGSGYFRHDGAALGPTAAFLHLKGAETTEISVVLRGVEIWRAGGFALRFQAVVDPGGDGAVSTNAARPRLVVPRVAANVPARRRGDPFAVSLSTVSTSLADLSLYARVRREFLRGI